MVEGNGNANAKNMFQAGIVSVHRNNSISYLFVLGKSNKFTKHHLVNFEDTSLDAASAAKIRAEKKIQKQAEEIEKQQKKIENEVFFLCF